ncbi:MAG: DUF1622 domain-containing protein [Candidatus Bathyarchaeota archaeon]|nr:DUF1622 domain-containing protein [Candidatus Bathyarchaeota archaeon]
MSFLSTAEDVFSNVASWLKLAAEISSVVLIGIGLVVSIYFLIQLLFSKQKKKQYLKLRLNLGRFLVLALELQLAADIIGTAIAPSVEQIGQLAAIALIRTFLNYFLNREIQTEEKESTEQESR